MQVFFPPRDIAHRSAKPSLCLSAGGMHKSWYGLELEFFGGSTIILGPRGEVRYAITKSVRDCSQIDRLRAYCNADVEFAEE